MQRRAVQIPRFDQFNQPWAGLRDHSHIAGELVEQRSETRAFQRAGSGQHTDHAGASCRSRRLDCWLHGDQGQLWIERAQLCHSRHGCGIARQHQRFGTPRKEELGDCPATLTNVLGAFLAIRHVSAVRDVEQRLVGQQCADFAQYREATHTGIENPDRRLTHRRGVRTRRTRDRA